MMAGISSMAPVDFADDPAGRSVGPRWNAARRRDLTLLFIGSGPAVRPLQVAARLNEQVAGVADLAGGHGLAAGCGVHRGLWLAGGEYGCDEVLSHPVVEFLELVAEAADEKVVAFGARDRPCRVDRTLHGEALG